MKKTIITLLVLIFLAVAYWLISPFFIEKRVSENINDIQTSTDNEEKIEIETISSGIFEGLENHSAQGSATMLKAGDKYYIRFEDDFSVTNGPDLFVYLGKNGVYDPSSRLSILKGNIGGQNYEIPSDINIENYNEVWIWCRAFSVPFAKAVLSI